MADLGCSHDTLLYWLSEIGSGRWERYRDAYNWMFPAGRREPWQTASFAARMLSTLGHLEIDWAAGRWAMGPPVLTLLPSAGAHGLLTGARTKSLMTRLESIESADEIAFSRVPLIEQQTAPSACLVALEGEASGTNLAAALGVDYSYSVSEEIGEVLPSVEESLRAARKEQPRRGYGVGKLDLVSLGWEDAERDAEPGLYRYDTPIRPELRLVDEDGSTYAPDLAVGVWAALSRWGEDRVKYDHKSTNGELIVPLAAPLPTLQARAAALCTGLEPVKRGTVLAYRNVPLGIASSVASSLGQTLIEIAHPAR